jgi:pimeloyl-ACP methyl ester carboxylesterase
MITQKMSRFRRAAALALVLPLAVGAVAACGDSAAPAGPAGSAPATSASAAGPVNAAPAAGLHMIATDGRKLAFHVTPGHSPTLVLDAGGGEDSSYWDALVPQLSRATGSQIITYDRAGMGASDEVPGPWQVKDAVGDLEAGLRRLGVTRNVVLVAHSQGGEIATYFVRDNPGLVSGAVLVDANLPQFFTDPEIARLVAATKPEVDAAKAGPSTQESRQLLATAASFAPVQHAYHQVSWPDAVPAIVIVSEKTPFDGSPEDVKRWHDAATAFAAAGPGRTLVTADGSSHEVPADRPDLVLTQIEKMTDARS